MNPNITLDAALARLVAAQDAWNQIADDKEAEFKAAREAYEAASDAVYAAEEARRTFEIEHGYRKVNA